MEYKCVLCAKQTKGYGNNPHPMRETGTCCDSCNALQVIPARLMVFSKRIKDPKEQVAFMKTYMESLEEEDEMHVPFAASPLDAYRGARKR
jgi:hypothetical protein